MKAGKADPAPTVHSMFGQAAAALRGEFVWPERVHEPLKEGTPLPSAPEQEPEERLTEVALHEFVA